ncbi:MAG: hypothetical protein ACI8S6_001031 [Myxococcota bacterium]|jgi:hypothetical protein
MEYAVGMELDDAYGEMDDLAARFRGMRIEDNINPDGLVENCYYCTVAYLAGYPTVRDMVDELGIMQQRRAGLGEIGELFAEAGVRVRNRVESVDPADLMRCCQSGGRFGLAYVRGDGSGHMVVISAGRIYDPQAGGGCDPLREGAVRFYFFEV